MLDKAPNNKFPPFQAHKYVCMYVCMYARTRAQNDMLIFFLNKSNVVCYTHSTNNVSSVLKQIPTKFSGCFFFSKVLLLMHSHAPENNIPLQKILTLLLVHSEVPANDMLLQEILVF